MLNRKFFFDHIRTYLYGGKLSQGQVAGMTAILDAYEKDYWNLSGAELAYILATVYHETDRKMQPIKEYRAAAGTSARRNQDRYWLSGYYGRGFVQLTWRDNYEKMSRLVGEDLVKTPDLALRLDISTKILFEGMIRGSFTGKKLSDYFSDGKTDWRNARRMINGLDKADLIASFARQFYAAICFVK